MTMIHDPEICVDCDGCGNSATINSVFTFSVHADQEYARKSTESKLRSFGWTCRDGKQFCCERCANKDL